MNYITQYDFHGVLLLAKSETNMRVYSYMAALFVVFPLAQSARADDCNGNTIIGSNNSVDCSGRHSPHKPSRQDALAQIRDYNRFPIYEIESVDYLNGYPKDSGVYTVVSSVNVRTRVSCEMMGSPAGMPRGGNIEEGVQIFAIGLAAIKFAYLFGGKCQAGERFSLIYEDDFQETENGWVLINQDTATAKRR